MDNQALQKTISELQEKAYTTPLSVSKTKDYANQSSRDIYAIQEKFLTLPENIKDKLVSHETSNKIQEIGKKYNLQLLQLADISRAIRSYYFGEIHLEDFPSILYKEMGVDLNTAKEISQIVIQKIINDDSQERAYQAQLAKISIPEALAKYPTVADQFVTSELISIRENQESVRPSLKNWLADYTYRVGYDAHSSIVRGNYVFQNENTRTLSNDDRQKLTYILKAYDEKTPVTVDTARKQIIFPATMDGSQTRIGAGTNPNFQSNASKPVYNFDNIQPASQPTRPPQNNLENNYERYHLPQQGSANLSNGQTRNISQNFRNTAIGSPEYKKPESQKSSPLVFSSPQKLPFEREEESVKQKAKNIGQDISPQVTPKPFTPEKPQAPVGPEPLRIHPVSPYNGHSEEDKEELPKNVVNLKV